MAVYVALLRAVNVGGTGKLPMVELKATAEGLGYRNVKTYIQSGNLIFSTDDEPQSISARLDERLGEKLGKPPGVFLRSPAEMTAIVDNNPFAAMPANQVLVSFLPELPGDDVMHGFMAPDGEEAVVIGREIYVHYPIGSGRSKIKLPALKAGTARNINTVEKLAQLAADLEVGA